MTRRKQLFSQLRDIQRNKYSTEDKTTKCMGSDLLYQKVNLQYEVLCFIDQIER